MNNQIPEPGIKQKLIAALQNPDLYDFSVSAFSIIETHISWVILTGKYAYKIKKPVNFGFVDFSTLEKRKYFCEEEIRLNSRFSTDIYLQTVAIRGSHSMPQLNGEGEIIEYAVKMREFSQDCLLSSYAADKRLKTSHIDSMANVIADIHLRAPRSISVDNSLGSAKEIKKWNDGNFKQLEKSIPKSLLPDYYNQLKTWSRESFDSLQTLVVQRQHEGFVRECHGDLHLGNIAFLDDQCTVFDCIEFNPKLRWIDTMSEVAFVVMDLQARGYSDLCWRFLNRYLAINGDYSGLAMLPFYMVYRALVRAKVEALLCSNKATNAIEGPDLSQSLHYLDLAQSWVKLERPRLVVMHGLSGSGKSTVAEHLASTLGAIQIRSDIERKRLFSIDLTSISGSAIDDGIYTNDASEQTYNHLAALAENILSNGFNVIVDAACLKSGQRALFRQLASKHQLPCFLISCEASENELRRRITQRLKLGSDASEANLDVLKNQLRTQQQLSNSERLHPNTLICKGPELSEVQLKLISDLNYHSTRPASN